MPLTPLMNLNLPTPTVTEGPEWATSVNTAFESIDSHDHSSGKGTKVTPDGININADLSVASNNVTTAKSYRMNDNAAALGDAADIRSLYATGGELYYNDTSGNQVQITASGGLNAASIGGIGGDYATSTALVSYSNISKAFLFEQNTGINALIDCADITIREAIASANGVKLKSPTTLAASYDLTLPTALPASEKIMTVDAAGNMATAYDVDGTSIEVASNVIQVPDAGITQEKVAVKDVQSSTGINTTITSASYTQIGTLSLTTSKVNTRVFLGIRGNSNSTTISLFDNAFAAGSVRCDIRLLRGGTEFYIGVFEFEQIASGAGFKVPGSSINTVDVSPGAAGAKTYTIEAKVTGAAPNPRAAISGIFYAYEL